MKQSISYYILMMVLKMKGLKKVFSQDPIDYQKIRKDDVLSPKKGFFGKNEVKEFKVLNTSITEVNQRNSSDRLLIFIHGGAFISGPSQIHWDSLRKMFHGTEHNVWMCNYPKAPEYNIKEISKNIDAVYHLALESYNSHEISIIGDSAGGALAITLTQRLIKKELPLPAQLILVSPVMDSTLSHPDIKKVDLKDLMLSIAGVLSAKKMCAGDVGLDDEMMSPINGNFVGFPPTMMFLAEHDITYPDQVRSVDLFKKSDVEIEIVVGEDMPHIWPYLPVMSEGKTALNQIINRLNQRIEDR